MTLLNVNKITNSHHGFLKYPKKELGPNESNCNTKC